MNIAIRQILSMGLFLVLCAGACGCTEALRKDSFQLSLVRAQDAYWLNKFNLEKCAQMATKPYPYYGYWYVSLEQSNIKRKSNYDGGIQALKNDHMNFDPTTDEIGSKYILAAKERSSVIKMYRPSINEKIVKIATSGDALGFNTSYSTFSTWDYALVEYSLDGRMRSALARQQQIYTNASPFLQDSFSVIIFDEGIRILERNVGNIELADAFIREV